MKALRAVAELGRRLLYWIDRDRRERELLEEMDAHRAQMADPERFGSTLRLGDAAREVWGWTWLEQLVQDLRVARRALARDPVFLATTTATLALAIGANTAIFSVVHAVLLEPLPFRDAGSLVAVWEHAPQLDQPKTPVAPASYAEWRVRGGVFAELGALDWRSFDLTGDGEPRRVQGLAVTPELFPMLGAEPALGRSFLPGEAEPGASRVALLADGLWRTRFGARRDVLGRSILLDGEGYIVVGVMPPRFQLFESYIGLWVPLALSPEEWRSAEPSLRVVARLRDGIVLEEARGRMGAIAAAVDRDDPGDATARDALLVPLDEELAGDAPRALLFLMAAVGTVLLAAGTNVGCLLLVRGLARRRELAIRAALGAGRGRVVRQLLAEGLLLCAPAAIAGVALARLGLPFVSRLLPPQLELSARVEIDAAVLAFTAVVSVLTALAVGLAPALRSTRGDPPNALSYHETPRQGRVQAALVAAEIALALLLAVQAALLVRSLGNLTGQYAGLRPERLLTARTALSPHRYWNAAARAAFYEVVLERVESLPGVRSAGYGTSVPLEWKGGGHAVVLEGRPPEPGRAFYACHRQVSAGYLETLGVPLIRGRQLERGDAEGAPLVAIVNETLARSFWPEREALGRRFALAEGEPWRTVVGVVADVRQMGAAEPVQPEMYLPYRQVAGHAFLRPRDLVVRAEVEPALLAAGLRGAVRDVDPAQPVALIRTMDEILGEASAAPRLQGAILTAFAGLATLLAALGTHGVIAHWVARSTREIGVRMALGARPAGILAAVLRRGARVTALGVAIGLLGCLAVAPMVRHLLFGVLATDPVTYAGVAAALAGVALASGLFPALRAARIAPVRALRHD